MLIDCRTHPYFDGHEEVHRFHDESTGLVAFVAIHRSGPLGVAGGGCRMWPYPSEDAALRDVLRLSQDMTHKLALAGLGAGGAKCVVLGDSHSEKSDALLERLGEAIHGLEGRFVVGGDVGTDSKDLSIIARRTPYVELGSFGRDTVSEATAAGVYWAILAAFEHMDPGAGTGSRSVAIQGVGKVGERLAELLARDGVSLLVSDIDHSRAACVAERLGARLVPSTEILASEVDVVAPCALGDVLSEESVRKLHCRAVVGSANNQLQHPEVTKLLEHRHILYVPDFVANMGGTLAGAKPHACRNPESVLVLTRQVGQVTRRILEASRDTKVSSHQAAVELAAERMSEQMQKKRMVLSWFHWFWRVPLLARIALRLRTWIEELRGRWLSASA